LHIFSFNLPTGTGTSSLVLKIKFFANIFCVTIFFVKHFFSPLNTFMGKGQDLDPDPYLGSGSGRPKNMRILRIRIRIPNTADNKKIKTRKVPVPDFYTNPHLRQCSERDCVAAVLLR
jgi:hypothetical protein